MIGAAIAAPSASFAQVNAEMAEILRDYVLDARESYEPRDGRRCVRRRRAHRDRARGRGRARDGDRARRDASAWSAADLPAPRALSAGGSRTRSPERFPADLVILNPPRAGVDERVTETLEAEAARLPRASSTSAAIRRRSRAISRRLPGYRIESLRAFDMFPQTAHVETVCELAPLEPPHEVRRAAERGAKVRRGRRGWRALREPSRRARRALGHRRRARCGW